MNFCYERVSTVKQDERRQEMAFQNLRIDKRYVDKMTGKNVDRPELNKLILSVNEGDYVYVESISRLGRNVDDLRKLCDYFVDKGVVVHFIKEGITTEGSTYKFLLTILGAVAEMERETIVERVRQGMEKAKLYGTKSGNRIGRPPREQPKDFERYYKKWKDGDISAVEFSKLVGVSRSTLYRNISEYSC